MFLVVYLYSTLIFGILNFVNNILIVLNVNLNYFPEIISIITFIFYWYSLFALFMFIIQGLPRITLLLPIYHLIIRLVILGVSIYFAWFNAPDYLTYLIFALGIVGSAFEIAVSLELIGRFPYHKKKNEV
jgi:hypothetical protein